MQKQKAPTPFQLSVYKELIKIPVGEVRTYQQIAKAIGKPKAARAVGNACNKNPFAPLVPCHRVVGSNGKLTGYAFGLKNKEKILQLESENKSINKILKEIEAQYKITFAKKLPDELV
jgi:methylated-DNA-[protein]-cysteine S-methyltransferase